MSELEVEDWKAASARREAAARMKMGLQGAHTTEIVEQSRRSAEKGSLERQRIEAQAVLDSIDAKRRSLDDDVSRAAQREESQRAQLEDHRSQLAAAMAEAACSTDADLADMAKMRDDLRREASRLHALLERVALCRLNTSRASTDLRNVEKARQDAAVAREGRVVGLLAEREAALAKLAAIDADIKLCGDPEADRRRSQEKFRADMRQVEEFEKGGMPPLA